MRPGVNRFGLVIPSVAVGTQPTATYGAAVTPGNLAYGTYVQLLPATSDDSWEVEIGINSVGIAATARDCLVQFAWDPAGGTNYGVAARTSIDHLLASCASAHMGGVSGLGGGIGYRFQVRIPASSTIAARAMVNSANVTAINVWCKLRCRPSRPHMIYRGTFVDTYGAVTANAAGTALTPGTAAKGAYVSLGALTQTYHQFEYGLGCNDLTMGNLGYDVDIALSNAAGDIPIIEGCYTASNTETLTKRCGDQRAVSGGVGSTLFARAQCSTTPDSAISAIAYAVGG
jgi:hypothetical protein